MSTGQRAHDPEAKGGLISAVLAGSIADRAGLRPGDLLQAINGHALRDLIDYRYYGADEMLVLTVERDDQRHDLEIERDYGQGLGLEFAQPLFDGIRRCNNHCPFCFVRQMPKGLRPSLYILDDDYRYSFLSGSFVTLTNLSGEDWLRIGEQHLSPLFVSVHATDLGTRRRILGNPSAPDILAQLRRLGGMGIQVHGQIVVWPGVNDGAVLRRSIEDLASLWPTLLTLAIVPVGLTRYHRGEVRLLCLTGAANILDMADSFIRCFRRRFGRTWLYPSDEIYLLAGRSVPGSAFYDDDAQRENGVGLVRTLLDDWAQTGSVAQKGAPCVDRATIVCGQLIAPFLLRMATDLTSVAGTQLEVVSVVNRFFGESVTVSGLLTGQDVLATLVGRNLGQRLFLPRVMFDAEGHQTLDGFTPKDITDHLGVPTILASRMSEVIAALQSADRRRTPGR